MAEAPNKGARWTDTEDSVVDLFPAREAAELLGRTYQAVRSRRDQKGLGPAHGNRKPRKRLRREYFQTGEGPREEVVVTEQAPAARVEVVPAAPSPNHVWIGGYWMHHGGSWVWVEGRYVVRPRPHAVWVPGHWERHPRGWVWVYGHWA